MNGLPANLKPLPTQPWDERPDELPLEVEECRTALWRAGGNITEASKILKISSGRFRSFVNKSSYLTRELAESREVNVDKAESVIFDALDDPERRDSAARFVLERLGRPRGWGSQSSKINVNAQGGTVVFQWADGSSLDSGSTQDLTGNIIDGTATEIIDSD